MATKPIKDKRDAVTLPYVILNTFSEFADGALAEKCTVEPGRHELGAARILLRGARKGNKDAVLLLNKLKMDPNMDPILDAAERALNRNKQ